MIIVDGPGDIIDPEKEIIHLVFENDADRLKVISHLQNMQPKPGVRLYTLFPDGTDGKRVAGVMDWVEAEAIKYFEDNKPLNKNNSNGTNDNNRDAI